MLPALVPVPPAMAQEKVLFVDTLLHAVTPVGNVASVGTLAEKTVLLPI